MYVRRLFARHLPFVWPLLKQLQTCLRISVPPTRAGDVGRRLAAVKSAPPYHMYVAGARGWATLMQFAGSVSRSWHPGGLWISRAEEMQSVRVFAHESQEPIQ